MSKVVYALGVVGWSAESGEPAFDPLAGLVSSHSGYNTFFCSCVLYKKRLVSSRKGRRGPSVRGSGRAEPTPRALRAAARATFRAS